MLLKKVTLLSFLFIMIGIQTPSYAVVHITNANSTLKKEQVKKDRKRFSFKEKIKLLKQVRSEIRAAKKNSPKKSNGVFQNKLFVFGFVLLIIGMLLGFLVSIAILNWIGGLMAVGGFIVMLVALIQEFR
ncbi:MAG: hypothetical protein ACI94Y_001042 [Maribacter sp.]|jgi:hypothetical protein